MVLFMALVPVESFPSSSGGIPINYRSRNSSSSRSTNTLGSAASTARYHTVTRYSNTAAATAATTVTRGTHVAALHSVPSSKQHHEDERTTLPSDHADHSSTEFTTAAVTTTTTTTRAAAAQPSTSTITTATNTTTGRIRPPKAKPRTGLAQKLLDWALHSPVWKLILVPQARKNIVNTAEANGIAWTRHYQWLSQQDGPWKKHNNGIMVSDSSTTATTMACSNTNDYRYPSYYTQEFHAYEQGNLSWEAAMEQELASRAVGARNFPSQGSKGEDAFRSSFEQAILNLGGRVPSTGGIVVDMGCGTGISTRRLSKLFPHAEKLLGLDLSPYFIAVGQRLLELAPSDEEWVTNVERDDRIELRVGNAADTNLDNESVDVVNLSLVIHELPIDVTLDVCQEAFRILKPGGQLFISEMDFDSPAYAAQRENALLFSLLRSTEPYLDEYADGVDRVREYLVKIFHSVKITAATGRHFALVATKKGGTTKNGANGGGLEDTRFDEEGNYIVADTHLKVWESKQEKSSTNAE